MGDLEEARKLADVLEAAFDEPDAANTIRALVASLDRAQAVLEAMRPVVQAAIEARERAQAHLRGEVYWSEVYEAGVKADDAVDAYRKWRDEGGAA